MKTKFSLIALTAVFFLSGCYTQLETIERPRGWNTTGQALSPHVHDAYSSFYTQEEADAYLMGFHDGIFDANLQFRHYNWHRHHASLGFHWGRPFVGFGFAAGHFYDPFWHHAMLYDPFFFSFYGVYAFPPHMRYRHWAHFHNPWWFGGGNIIVFNNWNVAPGNRDIVRGPRASGVHRGNVNALRDNRTASPGIAGDPRTRVRNNPFGPDAQPASIRTRGDGGTQPASVDRRTRGTGTPAPSVDRRPAAPPSQAAPARTRGNSSPANTGPTRSSGSSSQGDANRSRGGGSSNQGTVNRTRGNNNSGTQAAPQRPSSGTNNNSGTRDRNRNNNDSPETSLSMSTTPVHFNGHQFSLG